MKDKLIQILSSSRQFIRANTLVFKSLGFMLSSLGFFLISALLLNDFDLTGYSSSYLSKTIVIYCLVSLGVFIFFHTRNHLVQVLEEYSPIKYWHIGATTFLFFPLMVLGGQKEMFSWVTPLVSMGLMIVWSGRHVLRRFRLPPLGGRKYMQLWQRLKPQWTNQLYPLEANSEPTINYESVLISGAGTALGQKLLSLMSRSAVKRLVLIDSKEDQLAIMRAWVTQFLPQVQSVFLLSGDITPQSLKSLFKSYAVKYVFDLDRSFSQLPIEGSSRSLCHRNVSFPRMLLDQAVACKPKFVVSLSAMPLDGDDTLTTAQSLVESYAQRLDSDKTRVIPFRVRPLAEEPSIKAYVLARLWGQDKGNLQLAPVNQVATTILTILKQLIENPAHHGAIWEVTHVCVSKKLKFPREISSKDGLHDISQKIEAAMLSMKSSTLASDFLFPTSQEGAAIVADCPILETDFDKCFKDLEAFMHSEASGSVRKKNCS